MCITTIMKAWVSLVYSVQTIYHLFCHFSRQTRWDPPTWENADSEMDLGTPTSDDHVSKVSIYTGCLLLTHGTGV